MSLPVRIDVRGLSKLKVYVIVESQDGLRLPIPPAQVNVVGDMLVTTHNSISWRVEEFYADPSILLENHTRDFMFRVKEEISK